MQYGYKKQLNMSFDKAVIAIKNALPAEGFGVLTEINVHETMKKKLGIDHDKYIILGACNPQFAHQALMVEQEIGLLLPCNVIVYETGGQVFVSAILPTVAMGVVETTELSSIAQVVEAKLKKVVDSLTG